VALADTQPVGHLLLAESVRETSLMEQAPTGLRARDWDTAWLLRVADDV
jgi:hypothetical protein